MKAQTTFDDSHAQLIRLFVPFSIKRRGGAAMVIIPRDKTASAYFDNTMIKAFARAYQWQVWLKTGKYRNLNHLCDTQRIGIKYARQLYQLNLIAPQIIEAIIKGTQPRSLCLQDFMRKSIPVLWEEQLVLFGFRQIKKQTTLPSGSQGTVSDNTRLPDCQNKATK